MNYELKKIMRFLIISDIHGATDAFQLAIDAFQREHADYFILCGDYLYHGPRNMLPIGYEPANLAPLMNTMKEKMIAIRGNCDAEVDQMLLDFPIMSDYSTVFHANRRCLVTHGHLPLPPLSSGDIVISGHTHVPRLEEDNGILYVNPGSTTIPKSLSKPGYAVMDDTSVTLKTLRDGDIVKSRKL